MSKVGELRIVLLFVLVVIALTACAEPDDESTESIVGSWVWIESIGGFGGLVETPDSTGESHRVVFEANGEVTFYTNEDVFLSSTYSLGIDKTIFAEEWLPVVYVEDSSFMYAYSFPNIGQLELKENVSDGFAHLYDRE
ncbi:MAG: hypothetical protein SVY10_04545 [Thermodesulfobacteriota bacterium]|nr:hypothetical protein [Thermodesulfobacteriota bacterium]